MLLPSGIGARKPRKRADGTSTRRQTPEGSVAPSQANEKGSEENSAGADGETKPVAPPKHGRGASLEAWQKYARHFGLDPSGLTRAEIIEQVEGSDNG